MELPTGETPREPLVPSPAQQPGATNPVGAGESTATGALPGNLAAITASPSSQVVPAREVVQQTKEKPVPPSIDSLVSGMRAHLHQVRQKMVAKATIPTDVNLATSLYPGSPAGLTAFDKLDVNRDGVIDRDEFRQLTSAGVSVVTSPSKAGEVVSGFESQLADLGKDLRSSLRSRLDAL